MTELGTFVEVEATRPSRDRKQVERLTTGVQQRERTVDIAQGDGIVLADYPFFLAAFEKLRTDDDICKYLHLILFGVPGTKNDRKRNIRKFSGFTNENVSDKVSKFIERKAYTVSLVKVCSALIDLVIMLTI